MLIVTKPVVDIADVEINKLSKKDTSVWWNKGMDNKINPIKVYRKNPQTKFIWGVLLIWNFLYQIDSFLYVLFFISCKNKNNELRKSLL